MKSLHALPALLVLTSLLWGCGGGNDGSNSGNAQPSSNPPASSTPPNASSTQRSASVAGFVYAIDSSSNTVLAYTIDASSGGLTPVAGSPFGPASTPFPSGVLPHAMVVDPAERFVHVASWRTDEVFVYAIDDATGKLAQVPGSPYAAGNQPVSIRFHPSGKFAYVQTAVIVVGGQFTPSEIRAFSINQTTGQWSVIAGSPFPAGIGDLPLTFDRTGRFAYLLSSTNGNTDTITTFAIDGSGALTRVGKQAEIGTGDPQALAITPSGNYGYTVANQGVVGFRLDPVTGIPERIYVGQPINFYPGPFQIHPSGKFGYVAASGADDSDPGKISAFAIDDATGNLSELPGSPFAVKPNSLTLALHPSGKFAYVTSRLNADASGAISVFTIDGQTGSLSEIAGSPFAPGIHPGSITIDPSGRVAYVVEKAYEGPGQLLAFLIDTTTGALSSVNRVAAGMTPVDVTIAGTKR